MASTTSRYQGKPLLRLLECYVLWAIGELPSTHAKTLQEMIPKLQAIYGVQGTWQHILETVLSIPSEAVDRIRVLWTREARIDLDVAAQLTPQQFAEMIVDKNWPSGNWQVNGESRSSGDTIEWH